MTSTPPLTIRSATAADMTAVAEIYRPAVLHGTASFELAPPDVAEMTKRFEAIKVGGFPYVVAERQGRIVGYAYANAYRPRPAYRFSVEDSIYIDPAAQRSGAGQALLMHLIDTCTAMGFRQMIAVIGDSAQSASIGLHRRNGFLFSGTVHSVGYKFGRWLDGVIMQRPLGDGDQTPPLDQSR